MLGHLQVVVVLVLLVVVVVGESLLVVVVPLVSSLCCCCGWIVVVVSRCWGGVLVVGSWFGSPSAPEVHLGGNADTGAKCPGACSVVGHVLDM